MGKRLLSLPPVAFALEVADDYNRIGVARSASALAYFLILTLFPLLMCVNYFIGLLQLDPEQIMSALDQFLPAGSLSIILDYLSYVAANQSGPLLAASLFTIVLSASAGLRTLLQTMDELYGVTHTNSVHRVILSVVLSVLFLLTIYLSIVVILTGGWFFSFLEQHLPQRILELLPGDALSALSALWQWVRYLLLFCFVLALVLVVYRLGTPRRQASRRLVLCTATLTALAMVACSVLFSWFIGMSSRYSLVYGSLASVIILLVWLYFCGNILLLGAVFGRVWSVRRRKR